MLPRMAWSFRLGVALGAGFAIAAIGCGDGEASGFAGSSSADGATSSASASASTGASGTGGGGGEGASGGGPGPQAPAEQFLPKPFGTCPDFAASKATFSFDGGSRDVLLWAPPAKGAQGGPFVVFWHGVGGSPTEAQVALGSALDEIVAMGGVVAAPYHDPKAGQLPWYLALGGGPEDDVKVLDEIVACAISERGIDVRRIHSVGFSAGAMQTIQVGWRRSGYVASIVPFSGAQVGADPETQDPANRFPVMVVHGGPSDEVIINFATSAETYRTKLTEHGHFSFVCNHGKGHTVPSDIRGPAWRFLKDHPFGTAPSPYAAGLPAGFPSYCSL